MPFLSVSDILATTTVPVAAVITFFTTPMVALIVLSLGALAIVVFRRALVRAAAKALGAGRRGGRRRR